MSTKIDESGQGLPGLSGSEELILAMMLKRPAEKSYGLEFVRASGGRLKRGSIYVTLMRMGKKGYIESEVEESTQGEARRPRRH